MGQATDDRFRGEQFGGVRIFVMIIRYYILCIELCELIEVY